MRAIVREQAPALVLDSVMTMEERVMASLSRPRAYALVVGVMAAFALAIACVGLFGVLSYSVAQRSREIGVRTALGATTADVVALVLRSGLAIVAAGLAGGLAAAGLLVAVAVEDPLRRRSVRPGHVRDRAAVPGAGGSGGLRRAGPPRRPHRSASSAAGGVASAGPVVRGPPVSSPRSASP